MGGDCVMRSIVGDDFCRLPQEIDVGHAQRQACVEPSA